MVTNNLLNMEELPEGLVWVFLVLPHCRKRCCQSSMNEFCLLVKNNVKSWDSLNKSKINRKLVYFCFL